MNNLEYFIKKHSSTILSIISGIGVVSTTVLAVKATPKAIKLIDDAKKDSQEDLKALDIVKVAWKPYLPTAISGLATITCIFTNNYLNSKIQTSLMSAYAVLNESYKNYISSAEEILGDDKTKEIRNNMVKRQVVPYEFHDKSKILFFDYHMMRYFESTNEEVLAAEDKLNQEYAATGHVSINDFYRFLDLPELPYADRIGWSDNGKYSEINFDHEQVEFEDGMQCTIILMDEPVIDYYKY